MLSTKQSFYSCSNLIPNKALQILFICMSMSVLLLNVSILASTFISMVKQVSLKPFHVNMTFINIGDLLCGIYLIIMWSADTHFGTHYILQSPFWRQSLTCSTAVVIVLSFSLALPLCLSFLALSRHMVVKYPFGKTFKSNKKVFKYLLRVASICVLLTVGYTTLLATRNGIPVGLCSPYIDPTGALWEARFISIVTTMLHCSSIIYTICASILTVQTIKSSFAVRNQHTVQKTAIGKRTVVQLVTLTASNIISWVPSSVVFLVCLFMEQHPTNMLIWTIVAVVPLNSISNPVLFLWLTRSKQEARSMNTLVP